MALLGASGGKALWLAHDASQPAPSSLCGRLFLRKLKSTLRIPVLALVDSDPYGLKILSVYMKGGWVHGWSRGWVLGSLSVCLSPPCVSFCVCLSRSFSFLDREPVCCAGAACSREG